ncbi:hypothetical protein [Asaia prunellae]|uniref:hypothetical protein n=1 Tax=Asaia prunellae TaxID=610245 RepID=UPI000685D663|nr:hypothetical protein [Asaia prunellae]
MSASSRTRKSVLFVEALALASESHPFSLNLHAGEALSLLGEDFSAISLFCDILAGFSKPAQAGLCSTTMT